MQYILNAGISKNLFGHLAMLLFSVIVAGSFSLGSIIANDVSPSALTALRFLIAFIVIGLVAYKKDGFHQTDFTASWRYFLLGGVFVTYFVLMFQALKTAPPISTSAVFTLTPLLSAVAGYFLLKQLINTRISIALFIGAVGALWMIFRADINALINFNVGSGEIIFFIGCIFHAVYTPLVRKLNRGETPLVFTSGTLLAGALILFLFFWRDIFSTSWSDLSLVFWMCLLYLAIFASAITVWLIHHATMRLPSSKVMAYTYLIPSWVILWELVLGNSPPSLIVLMGLLLIIVSLLMLLRE